jgi:hypothetical protein
MTGIAGRSLSASAFEEGLMKDMPLKIYLVVTGGLFFSIGVLHLLRLVHGVPVTVGPTALPMFLSSFGLGGSVCLVVLAAWLLFRK